MNKSIYFEIEEAKSKIKEFEEISEVLNKLRPYRNSNNYGEEISCLIDELNDRLEQLKLYFDKLEKLKLLCTHEVRGNDFSDCYGPTLGTTCLICGSFIFDNNVTCEYVELDPHRNDHYYWINLEYIKYDDKGPSIDEFMHNAMMKNKRENINLEDIVKKEYSKKKHYIR
jgi:hypothetical protein